MEENNVVCARGLTVHYGEHAALDGLDLTARSGQITALLGRNGAGKTTLIRAIATLQAYSAGMLTVVGHEVKAYPHAVRGAIGLAGQYAAVVPELTGWENLRLVGRLYGLTRRDAIQAARRVADEFDLGEFADRRASTYSGGQRRRLDLAATFVVRPALLLLDEPTSGLDSQSRRGLWVAIRNLSDGGTSVLLTTQYLEEAQALADYVAVIDHGHAIRAGTPGELRRATATTTLTVTANHHFAETTAKLVAARLDATITVYQDDRLALTGQFELDDAYRAVAECGLSSAEITEFALAPPSLEDVFLAMTPQGAAI